MAQLNSDEVKHNTLLRQSCLDKIHNHECSDDDEALLVLRSDSDDENQKTESFWTRVFSRDIKPDLHVGIYPIGPDLIFDASVRSALTSLNMQKGEILFSPLLIPQKSMDLRLENNRLSDLELTRHALMATQIR